ncbi:MAG: hypothetical protein ACRDTM_10515 [Micromonosporaceae bacterium]
MAILDSPVVRAIPGIWRDAAPVERACYLVSAALFVSGLVHLGVYAIDGGPWQGPVSWRKPVTFGLSFGITLASVTFAASFLSRRDALRRLLLGVFAVASCFEVGLITLQAWWGVPSHFNRETALDGAIATALAIGGVTLIVIVVALTVLTWRGQGRLTPELLAVRAGVGTLLGALAVGGAMIAVGVTTTDPQVAYATAGGYKPAHAVLMHAVTVLPVLGWLTRFTGWPAGRRTTAVWLAVGGYLLTAAVVVEQTFAGIDTYAMGVLPTALAITGLALLVGTGLTVLTVALRGR